MESDLKMNKIKVNLTKNLNAFSIIVLLIYLLIVVQFLSHFGIGTHHLLSAAAVPIQFDGTQNLHKSKQPEFG